MASACHIFPKPRLISQRASTRPKRIHHMKSRQYVFSTFEMYKTSDVRMAKVKGPRSGRLARCCALSGPPPDHRSISSSVSASTGHCHPIADLIFLQGYRTITNKPFTGRFPLCIANGVLWIFRLSALSRRGVRALLWECVSVFMSPFFIHLSYSLSINLTALFCSSLKARGLIQRSSETCKLSISHCKVCKLPPASLGLPSCALFHRPSLWMEDSSSFLR